jgi:hypothetical protein
MPNDRMSFEDFLKGNGLECPASALVRQNWRLEEGRISGSS